MEIEYFFRVDAEKSKYKEISSILESLATRNETFWEFSSKKIEQMDKFVECFLTNLNNKEKELSEIGISITEDVSFWFYYQYDEQCNLSFSSNFLKLLSDSGIELSISCWLSSQWIEITGNESD